jgi:hypothetical protein
MSDALDALLERDAKITRTLVACNDVAVLSTGSRRHGILLHPSRTFCQFEKKFWVGSLVCFANFELIWPSGERNYLLFTPKKEI